MKLNVSSISVTQETCPYDMHRHATVKRGRGYQSRSYVYEFITDSSFARIQRAQREIFFATKSNQSEDDTFKPTNPCPFCGSKNNRFEKYDAGNHHEYAVMCKNCGAFGPNDLGKSGASEMWDMRRSTIDAPAGR